jgi:hypothetical protein
MVRFQNPIKDLFLMLHRHKIHRQQRVLSKFLMYYQQFASHVYCGAMGSVSEMASQQEKALCVLRSEVLSLQCSVIFLHGLKKNAPHKNNVTR